MATGGSEEDAFWQAGLDRTPQEELLTPGRAELVRLARARSNWDQDPTGIFNDEQRAAIAGAAPTLGEGEDDLLLRLANEVKRVAAVGSVADVKNAILDQLARLRDEVDARMQEEGTGGAAAGLGLGTNAGDGQVEPPASSRLTRQSGSLQKQLEDARLALDNIAAQSELVDEQNLGACEAALRKLIDGWTHLRSVLRGLAEAERLSQKQRNDMEQKEYARMFPAKTHLEAAVRVQKEKLHKNRHVAARQAVDRSLEEVDEVIQGGDAAEIEELHRQLEKQREAMTATAVHVGLHQLEGIAGVQADVNKSLRRLARARRDLQKGTNAGSLFSPAASDGGGGGGEEDVQPPRFQLPPADESRVSEAEAGLTSSQLCQLINSLVGGTNPSKLPMPAWPKFDDSYRSYFAFKEELPAFIRDYGQGTLDRTLAQQIKANCLSKNSAVYVEWAWSPAAILETLGGLFGRPSWMVESLLGPVKKQKRIQMDDYPAQHTSQSSATSSRRSRGWARCSCSTPCPTST
jgi:hypothetical protein